MTGVLSLLSAVAGAIIGHSILARLLHSRIAAFLWAAGVCGVLFVFLLHAGDTAFADFIGWILAYAFAMELYLFIFTLSAASIGSNLLAMLDGKPATQADIDARYDERQMVVLRIDRLLAAGLIADIQGSLVLTPAAMAALARLDDAADFFAHGSRV